MKINNIVELIYAPYGYGWGEVGDIGILTQPFGPYSWMVDIVDPATGKVLHSDRWKQEQMRVLDEMPKEKRIYSEEEKAIFEQMFKDKETELRNFKEYDLVEIIRDRPEYAKEGFGVGDMGTVLFNDEHGGQIEILVRNIDEFTDTELVVRREDVRKVDKWHAKKPTYSDEQKQSFIELSNKLAEEYKQKDIERRKKFGY